MAKRTQTSGAAGLGAPPRAWLLSGWALLVLRAYLGVVFIFAGLEKLANPSFFDDASPYSLHAQMEGYARVSPIGSLLHGLLPHAALLGYGIALGELAVGIGIALGLFTRVAAVGGALIALSLWLSVSFHAYPWFTSDDLVYFMAFSAFVIAGSGGVLSLDALIARRAASERGAPDPTPVVVAFATVQGACGFHHEGACTAVTGRTCAPAGCPYLEGRAPTPPVAGRPDELERRRVLSVVAGAGAAVAAGIAAVGVALGGRALGSSPSADAAKTLPGGGSTGSSGASGASGSGGSTSGKGTLIGPAADVPVGQSATFSVPGSGDPGLVIQEAKGDFVAYNAVCPHEGCTVGYQPQSNIIACPCHGSEFEVSNGDVIRGPALVGLTKLDIADDGGQLYVS